jgi:hypothetical protein
MWRLAILFGVMASASAQAAECTISTARYKNDSLAWFLTFKPVPQFSPATQTAAFIIELPNSGVTLEGAVHRPNGFGSPLWSISGPCQPSRADSCTFAEGDGTAIYGNYAAKVGWLDDKRGAIAPEQVILPRLAASLWYSAYRNNEFETEAPSSDVFSLTGCDY